MLDEPQRQWVVAERRADGTDWPLIIVSSEVEAMALAESLRQRGRDVRAIPVDGDAAPPVAN